ncbi:hypothetical protein Dimus_001964, partial [Dionaea muscipula]
MASRRSGGRPKKRGRPPKRRMLVKAVARATTGFLRRFRQRSEGCGLTSKKRE